MVPLQEVQRWCAPAPPPGFPLSSSMLWPEWWKYASAGIHGGHLPPPPPSSACVPGLPSVSRYTVASVTGGPTVVSTVGPQRSVVSTNDLRPRLEPVPSNLCAVPTLSPADACCGRGQDFGPNPYLWSAASRSWPTVDTDPRVGPTPTTLSDAQNQNALERELRLRGAASAAGGYTGPPGLRSPDREHRLRGTAASGGLHPGSVGRKAPNQELRLRDTTRRDIGPVRSEGLSSVGIYQVRSDERHRTRSFGSGIPSIPVTCHRSRRDIGPVRSEGLSSVGVCQVRSGERHRTRSFGSRMLSIPVTCHRSRRDIGTVRSEDLSSVDVSFPVMWDRDRTDSGPVRTMVLSRPVNFLRYRPGMCPVRYPILRCGRRTTYHASWRGCRSYRGFGCLFQPAPGRTIIGWTC